MFKKQCACGCGMKMGLGDRGKVKAAMAIDGQIKYLSSVTLPAFTEDQSFQDATPLRRFIQEGKNLSKGLNADTHGSLSGRDFLAAPTDVRAAMQWSKVAREIEGMTLEGVAAALNASGG